MRISIQIAAGLVVCCAAWSLTLAQSPSGVTTVQDKIEQARKLQREDHTAEARKIYEGVLPMLRESGPLADLANVLNALSHMADADGEYDAAVHYAQEAAQVYRRNGDAKGEGHALLNKGIAEMDLGAYKSAHDSLAQALLLSRAAKDSENEVQVLNNQGNTHYYQGNYLDALRSYQQAKAAMDHTDTAWAGYWRQVTDFNEATLYQRLGRYGKALEIYRQVQGSSDQLTTSNRAHLFGNLGALYRRLGDAYKALDAYRAAQKLYAMERDADGEIGVLKNIGIVYAMDLEDLKKAEQIFRDSLSLAGKTHNRREEMQAHLYRAETFLREKGFLAARQEFDRALTLANELGTTEEQWKALYGRGRVEELTKDLPAAEADYRRAIAIIEASRAGLQLSALRAEFLADKRDAYDSLLSILFSRHDAPEAFAFLERSRARTFQDRLMAARSAPPSGPFGLDEARSHLDPAAMLLEFWASPRQIGLIWCTRDASGMSMQAISPADLKQIRGILQDVPEMPDEDWRGRLGPMDALLSRSLPSFPANIKQLMIVPDNWLSFVPFDLLRATGSATLLVEQFDISYLPSATLLRRPMISAPRLHFPWTRQLVAFGNPAAGADQLPLDKDGGSSFRPLPYSAQEIHSVAAMVHGKADLFLGESDRKQAFVGGAANRASLLHVSTHALADADNPEESRVLFSPGSASAGADYLFLRELYDVDLSNVQLATLSACDTERGPIIRGEGVQAFSRALLAAGSRSAVTTLWRVEDAATAQFMQLFYFFALEKGKPKAEALRLAKLKFLNSKSRLENPRYWAAFILNGESATPLPKVLSWGQLIAGCIFILAAAGFLLSCALRLRRGNDGKHIS